MWKLLPDQVPHFDAAVRDTKSKTARVRALAAQSLANPPEGKRDEAVVALRPLIEDPDLSVRYTALASLGEFDDVESVPALLARLDDKAPSVRELAVIVLGRINDERARAAVLRALESEHPEMRFQAITSLAEERTEGATEKIAPKLGDSDKEVRAAAALALAKLGDARGKAVLITLLDHRDHATDAAIAIGALRILEARDGLVAITQKILAPAHLKAAAASSLVQLGDPRGSETLHAMLASWRAPARTEAAYFAGLSRDATTLPELAAMLENPRGVDPEVVVHALVRLAKVDEGAETLVQKLGRRTDDIGRFARTTHPDDE